MGEQRSELVNIRTGLRSLPVEFTCTVQRLHESQFTTLGSYGQEYLRDCPVARLRAWLGAGVTEFKEKVAEYRREGGRRPLDSAAAGDGGAQATDDGYDTDDEDDTAAGRGGGEEEKRMVTCTMESTLGEVVEKAVENHVHRLWVVDEEEGLLRGVVSLTDVLRVVREAALGEDQELHSLQDIVSS